jgi:hypothetical protein
MAIRALAIAHHGGAIRGDVRGGALDGSTGQITQVRDRTAGGEGGGARQDKDRKDGDIEASPRGAWTCRKRLKLDRHLETPLNVNARRACHLSLYRGTPSRVKNLVESGSVGKDTDLATHSAASP